MWSSENNSQANVSGNMPLKNLFADTLRVRIALVAKHTICSDPFIVCVSIAFCVSAIVYVFGLGAKAHSWVNRSRVECSTWKFENKRNCNC